MLPEAMRAEIAAAAATAQAGKPAELACGPGKWGYNTLSILDGAGLRFAPFLHLANWA